MLIQSAKWYTHYKTTIHVSFPEDKICCNYCTEKIKDIRSGQEKCMRTGEILYRPQDGVGCQCPLIESEGD